MPSSRRHRSNPPDSLSPASLPKSTRDPRPRIGLRGGCWRGEQSPRLWAKWRQRHLGTDNVTSDKLQWLKNCQLRQNCLHPFN